MLDWDDLVGGPNDVIVEGVLAAVSKMSEAQLRALMKGIAERGKELGIEIVEGGEDRAETAGELDQVLAAPTAAAGPRRKGGGGKLPIWFKAVTGLTASPPKGVRDVEGPWLKRDEKTGALNGQATDYVIAGDGRSKRWWLLRREHGARCFPQTADGKEHMVTGFIVVAVAGDEAEWPQFAAELVRLLGHLKAA